MAGDADTKNSDEAPESTDDGTHSDAIQQSDEPSNTGESTEDLDAGEDGEPTVGGDGDEPGDDDAGGAESGESEPGEGAEEPAAQPQPESALPWEKIAREHESEVRRLRTEREQMLPFLLKALEERQQRDKPQPQAPPPAKPWIPYGDEPDVQRAIETLRANPEAFEKLPITTREKALQANSVLTSRWGEYSLNPKKLVEEHVLPFLDGSAYVAKLAAVEKKLHDLEAEAIRRQGREEMQRFENDLKTPQDRQEVVDLVRNHGFSIPKAVEYVAMKRRISEFDKQKPKIDERAKSQAAHSARTRGQQATKRGQGPAAPQAERSYGTLDAREIARRVKRDLNIE